MNPETSEQFSLPARGPQLVAALFCRDVIYDDDWGQILSMRIVQSFRPSLRSRADFDEDTNYYTDLWFLVIMSNMPQLMEDPDDPDEIPPDEMSLGVRAINPNGEVGFNGKLFMYPEGPLGVASFQIGWEFPTDQSGVLAVELDYLGRHLTTAFLELVPDEPSESTVSAGR